MDGYFSGLHRELANLVELFPEVDRTVDRHHYHGLMEQLVQEFNHYVLLADIMEHLLGRKIAAEDTNQLREEKALGDLRRSYAAGSAIEKAAVLVTEGGGARLFREGRKLKGSPLERKIAAAMDVVYQDEKNHCRAAAREAASAVRHQRDLKAMKRAIQRVSLQRGPDAERDVPVPALGRRRQGLSGKVPQAGLTRPAWGQRAGDALARVFRGGGPWGRRRPRAATRG